MDRSIEGGSYPGCYSKGEGSKSRILMKKAGMRQGHIDMPREDLNRIGLEGRRKKTSMLKGKELGEALREASMRWLIRMELKISENSVHLTSIELLQDNLFLRAQ